MIKLCTDCKYHTTDIHLCKHMEARKLYPVTGIGFCDEMREEASLCGLEGKLFKLKYDHFMETSVPGYAERCRILIERDEPTCWQRFWGREVKVETDYRWKTWVRKSQVSPIPDFGRS